MRADTFSVVARYSWVAVGCTGFVCFEEMGEDERLAAHYLSLSFPTYMHQDVACPVSRNTTAAHVCIIGSQFLNLESETWVTHPREQSIEGLQFFLC